MRRIVRKNRQFSEKVEGGRGGRPPRPTKISATGFTCYMTSTSRPDFGGNSEGGGKKFGEVQWSSSQPPFES
jgi:hypothetical protein